SSRRRHTRFSRDWSSTCALPIYSWPPGLEALRTRLRDELEQPFNSVLANLYRDGRDAMGWHSDDEPELGPEPLIASLSLGAVRQIGRASWRGRGRDAGVARVVGE